MLSPGQVTPTERGSGRRSRRRPLLACCCGAAFRLEDERRQLRLRCGLEVDRLGYDRASARLAQRGQGRCVGGSTVDVEDYTINRWMLYGTDHSDKAKRPQLVITYSYLR